MAMVQPTVVYQKYSDWVTGRLQNAITCLGNVTSAAGGTASVYYDNTANVFCIDSIS